MTARTLAVHFMLGLFLVPAMALAQAQGGDQGGRQRGGDRGNFDPAQMQARYMASIKEAIGATDEEWRLLQPKVEKLMTLQRNTRGGGMMGGRGQRGGGDQPESAVAVASRELRTALENQASAEELARKLTALREAREKARTEVAAAQKELKELLTVKQEAALVVRGILD